MRTRNHNQPRRPKVSEPYRTETSQVAVAGIAVEKVAELAVDIWKIMVRARNDHAGERVLVACERAEDRLKSSGFEIVDMQGRPYDTNMVGVRVLQHDDGTGPITIQQCLSPAVYYKDVLVREAEVITEGC